MIWIKAEPGRLGIIAAAGRGASSVGQRPGGTLPDGPLPGYGASVRRCRWVRRQAPQRRQRIVRRWRLRPAGGDGPTTRRVAPPAPSALIPAVASTETRLPAAVGVKVRRWVTVGDAPARITSPAARAPRGCGASGGGKVGIASANVPGRREGRFGECHDCGHPEPRCAGHWGYPCADEGFTHRAAILLRAARHLARDRRERRHILCPALRRAGNGARLKRALLTGGNFSVGWCSRRVTLMVAAATGQVSYQRARRPALHRPVLKSQVAGDCPPATTVRCLTSGSRKRARAAMSPLNGDWLAAIARRSRPDALRGVSA